jgi:Arc/MetJ family transcription regulator
MVRALSFVAALILLPAGASAQQPCTADARHVVNELYRHVLERSADRGSDQFVQRLNRGTTVREIVRELAKSAEHTQRFTQGLGGADGRRAAVTNLFRHVLGRQPDPDGLEAHAAGITAQGPAAVVDAMVNSDEYTANFGDFGVPGSQGLRFCSDGQVSRRARERNAIGTSGSGGLTDRAFETLDRNRNGRLERNEWNGTSSEFDELDRNGNNILSRAETTGAASGTGNTALRREFAELDSSGDGRVSIQEWNWNRRTFDQQDVNSDGFITLPEFTGAPASTGPFNFGR